MSNKPRLSLWGLSISTINEFEKYLNVKILMLQSRIDAYHEVLEEIAKEKVNYANTKIEKIGEEDKEK